MIRFGLLFTLVVLALWIYAIFDSITAETDKVRTLQKPLWVLIVLLFGPILASGSIAWLLWGRPRVSPSGGSGGWGSGGHGPRGPGGPGGPSRPGGGPRGSAPGGWGQGGSGPHGRTRPRPIAPDDDPDFLRSL